MQPRWCFATALLIASAAVGATSPSPEVAPPNRGGDSGADTSEHGLYAIPTRADQIGRIVALVSINGRGPFRFMLDTGSNRTVLAQSVLSKIGLVADDQAPIGVTGINGSEQAPSVHIDSLDTGDLHFRDVRMPVLTGPLLRGLDGILGMDGFNDMKVSADFSGDKFGITVSHGGRAPVVYSVLPIRFLSGRLLMADALVGRIHVEAIIDTGSPRTLGDSALLAALTGKHKRNERRLGLRVIDATQTAEISAIGTVPSLSIGSVMINHLDVLFGPFKIFKTWQLDRQPALLIGMDVLGTLDKLSIDYRRREVALLPLDDPPMINKRWFSLAH